LFSIASGLKRIKEVSVAMAVDLAGNFGFGNRESLK